MTRVGNYIARQCGEWRQCVEIRRRLAKRHDLSDTVLIVGHELRKGGASMLSVRLANELCRKGRNVVLLINAGSGMDPDVMAGLNAEVMLFQLHAATRPSSMLLAMLKQRGCHECIANTVVTGLFADQLREHGFQTIWLIHEMACSCRILRAEELVGKILHTAKTVVFPDWTVQESFLSLSREKHQPAMEIIPQGIYKKLQPTLSRDAARDQLCAKYAIPKHAVLLTGAGSANFGKGVDLLVPVLAELARRGKETGAEYHLMWIGNAPDDDPYVVWLKRQIETAGLERYWHWSGFVANDAQYVDLLCATDIFLLPSREDSYPSAMLEALYMGIPALAFSGSGGGASMALSQHGYSVQSSDLMDMCRKIELFASKPAHLMDQAAACARKLRQESGFDRYTNNVLNLLSNE